MLLHKPNNAYATPGRVLKSDYSRVFNENHNRDMFVACILIQREVDRYLSTCEDEIKSVRSIIRYYVSMAVACSMLKSSKQPTDRDLASLVAVIVKDSNIKLIDSCTNSIITTYQELGARETIAKGPEMRQKVLQKLVWPSPNQGEL